MHAIKLERLTKNYGQQRGVSDVSLKVKKGEIFGFIGPNGAGKSTTIRMMMQLVRPSSGMIQLLGKTVTREDPALRRQLGYLPSEVQLYPEMNGRELLAFAAASHGIELQRSSAAEYAERLQLDLQQRIRSYSLGNRKKLGIVLALIHHPSLVILDEPTSGLDPLIQQSFFDLLKELNRTRGMTIFFSTHVLSEVEKVCSRVAFIRDGQLIRVSDVAEMVPTGDHVVLVKFQEPGDFIDAYSLRVIDSRVRYDGVLHRLRTGDRLNDTLARLAQLPVESVTIRKPTIEELFMEEYRIDHTERDEN